LAAEPTGQIEQDSGKDGRHCEAFSMGGSQQPPDRHPLQQSVKDHRRAERLCISFSNADRQRQSVDHRVEENRDDPEDQRHAMSLVGNPEARLLDETRH
jgi:hypothetical protein